VNEAAEAPLVLIVEDNERNLTLVRDLLQINGYRTIEARTASDGFELAVEHRPALVLMDIQLPDGDGVDVLVRLRADDRTASISVVALTAQAMSSDEPRLLAAGFDGYLEKPISTRLFPTQVHALLESRRLPEPA